MLLLFILIQISLESIEVLLSSEPQRNHEVLFKFYLQVCKILWKIYIYTESIQEIDEVYRKTNSMVVAFQYLAALTKF